MDERRDLLGVAAANISNRVGRINLGQSRFPLTANQCTLINNTAHYNNHYLHNLLNLELQIFVLLPNLPSRRERRRRDSSWGVTLQVRH